MRQLESVIWRQGDPLTPHQLQQQDRNLWETICFTWNSLKFRPWGFSTLVIDRESLAAGILRISKASGILPNGVLFDIPNSDAAPEPISLSESEFWLALPNLRPSVEMFRDENNAANEKPVRIARKRFRLTSESEAASLPIARVQLSPAGVYEIDRAFVPPLLSFVASEYLASIARRLVEDLSARAVSLRNAQTDPLRFWLLYTVNTWIPVFRHLYENGGHPEALFSAMTEFAGSFSPRDLPLYDHDKLGECFAALDARLRLLLENAAPRHWISLPFKYARPSIYTLTIDDDRRLEAPQIYLAIRADASPEKALKLVKVASTNHIEQIIQQALPGIALTRVPQPPGIAPAKLGFEYFALEKAGSVWDAVARSRSLAAYVPADLPRPELELIVRSAPERGQ